VAKRTREREASVDDLMSSLSRSIDRKRARRGRRMGGHAWRVPWWAISFFVHLFALVVLARTHFSYIPQEEPLEPIALKIITRPPPEPAKPKKPEPKPDPPVEKGPERPEPRRAKEPGPKLPPAAKTVEADPRPEPSESRVARTRVFATQMKRRGYHRGIYSARGSSGRARTVGGRGGTSLAAERTVQAGLLWLAKAQERDGRWSCRRWGGGDDYDVGVTGLAVLAFLGAGYTHRKGNYRGTVARGLRWLRGAQSPDGRFAWRTFYEQGIATMAVCEAFGLTRSLELEPMAQRAVHYICHTQPDHGGFRYAGAVVEANGDLSVTGWQIMACRSAICAELDLPIEAVERSRAFLKSTYRDDGGSVYLAHGRGSSPTMTAVGMLCRQFLGGDIAEEIQASARYLVRHERQRKARGPGKGRDRLVGDLYYTYYSVLAMFQMGGEHWVLWNRLFRDALVRAQVRTRYDAQRRYVLGSWDPGNHAWGSRGGRVYTTAMATLCLEVYYRFLPIYRK